MPVRTHYDVLGVNTTAPPEVIRASARALLKANHPDLAHGDEAERLRRTALCQEITAAQSVLLDLVERTRYDDGLKRAKVAEETGIDPEQVVDEDHYDPSAWDEVIVEGEVIDPDVTPPPKAPRPPPAAPFVPPPSKPRPASYSTPRTPPQPTGDPRPRRTPDPSAKKAVEPKPRWRAITGTLVVCGGTGLIFWLHAWALASAKSNRLHGNHGAGTSFLELLGTLAALALYLAVPISIYAILTYISYELRVRGRRKGVNRVK